MNIFADGCTTTQVAAKAKPQIDRTLMKVSEYVKGFKSTTIETDNMFERFEYDE